MSTDPRGIFGRTVLIGSGAIGTCLRARCDLHGGLPVEVLNTSNPEAVVSLHRDYVEAGSNVLITNTFAANAVVLGEMGLEDLLSEINRAGVELARKAAGTHVAVWGSVGPLSLGLRLADFSDQQLADIFARQCSALSAADAIVLETFVDRREAFAAIRAAKSTSLPVIFQIGNVGGGRDRLSRVAELADIAVSEKVVAIGTNCQQTSDLIETAAFLLNKVDIPVTAAPNAGHATVVRGTVIYHFSPEEMKRAGIMLWEMGASLIGGCCGTTPEHIRALAAAVGGKAVAPRRRSIVALSATPTPVAAKAKVVNPVRDLVRSRRFMVSAEIRADRRSSLDEIVAGASLVAASGVDMFDVPDNPAATVGRDAMVVAARLQQSLGIPSFPHKSSVQANLIQIHSSLLGCWDLGLKAVLVVTGDPPSLGHLSGMAKLVTDIKSSVELLRLIRELRNGIMINGEEVGDPPDFCVGCAIGQPTPQQFSWFAKKVDAGAEFAFSQPIFDIETFHRLMEGTMQFGIRILPGLLPLTSKRMAESLAAGRIPGVRVPDKVVKGFDKFKTAADQRKFGLEMTAKFAEDVIREGASGIYLVMPFGKSCYQDTAMLVRQIKDTANVQKR